MRKSVALAALVLLSFPVTASAPAQTFEKKNYNYSEWTKGRFSEAVTVTGPGKMIFLAGVGAEDESGATGTILYKGDFAGQFKYDYGKCRVEAFGNHPLRAHTLLTISQLAWPGMIVEIDVTAIVAK